MAKNKPTKPKNIWQYSNWLCKSGRITQEEYATLCQFADKLEQDTFDLCLE